MEQISIVEDNEDNRMLLYALLSDDYEIIEYEDGYKALDGIPQNPTSVVLLDISLPGLDGIGVLKKLRELVVIKDSHIIALTAHAMSGDRERFMSAGFDDYITKPIMDEDLLFSAIEKGFRKKLLSQ